MNKSQQQKIQTLVQNIPTPDKLDLDYEDEWERGFMTGEAQLARKIRQILNGPAE